MFEYKGPAKVSGFHEVILPTTFPYPGDDGQEYYVELKIYKNKPKSTLQSQIGPDRFKAFTDDFWRLYPKRNGKHLNKAVAHTHLNKLKPTEMNDVLRGARNFALSKQAREGFAPDAHRWLARRGWEEWQEGEEKVRNRATL
jgi:hypothetical protein